MTQYVLNWFYPSISTSLKRFIYCWGWECISTLESIRLMFNSLLSAHRLRYLGLNS